MSSEPAAKRNGRTTARPVCRHSPACEVAQTQRDLQAQVQVGHDALGTALGEVVDELRNLRADFSVKLEQIAGGQLETRERVTVLSQRQELDGRLITALVRHFTKQAGPEAGKALADEFAAVQAQAARELGGDDA